MTKQFKIFTKDQNKPKNLRLMQIDKPKTSRL